MKNHEDQICIYTDNLEKIIKNINGEVIYDESVKLKDARIAELEEAFHRIIPMCNNPDTAQACRLILNFCNAVLEGK